MRNYLIQNYPFNFYVTYVLRLEGDNYYVGRTKNGKINARINQHKVGSAGWTFVHKFCEVVGVYKGDIEKEKTLELRKLYGKDKVRGYVWVKTDDPDLVCYEEQVPKPEMSADAVAALFA